MSTESGLKGYLRVIELVGEPHPESVHDGARPEVTQRSERDDLLERQVGKAECNG